MKPKAKRLSLALVALLVAGGLWLSRTAWTPAASNKSNTDVGAQTPDVKPEPGHMLRPPDPAKKFIDFTPEQRVEFARKGHGPGG
jgi:hypothetical protein